MSKENQKSNGNEENKSEEWKGPGLSTIGLHVGQEEPRFSNRIEGGSHILNNIIRVQRHRTCSKPIWS